MAKKSDALTEQVKSYFEACPTENTVWTADGKLWVSEAHAESTGAEVTEWKRAEVLKDGAKTE